jgi:hypothetical protein
MLVGGCCGRKPHKSKVQKKGREQGGTRRRSRGKKKQEGIKIFVECSPHFQKISTIPTAMSQIETNITVRKKQGPSHKTITYAFVFEGDNPQAEGAILRARGKRKV